MKSPKDRMMRVLPPKKCPACRATLPEHKPTCNRKRSFVPRQGEYARKVK